MKQILVECCGKCPYFREGEISQSGERWYNDFCAKGYGDIYEKNYILETCELEQALCELM
jgi:hypothetical protein